MTFTPTGLGIATATYVITADDGQGEQVETLIGNGANTLPPPTSGWQLNGTAAVRGGALQLTPAAEGRAGSAVYPNAVASDGLDTTFLARIAKGTGADGMTFALLDPTQETAGSLGFSGGALGFGGLHGVAVALDTYQNGTDPSANFVGVSTGGDPTDQSSLIWAQTSTAVPNLRAGTHRVHVHIAAGRVTVEIDDVLVLDVT